MTKANQPRIAFLRWCALQRPARAARAVLPLTQDEEAAALAEF